VNVLIVSLKFLARLISDLESLPPHNLPHPLQSRKLLFNDERGQFSVESRGATENIDVNLVQFGVRVGTKVALRKYENSRSPMGFKLVKGSAHDCEPAPFSDSIHNFLEVNDPRYPHTFDMSDEVLHLLDSLGVAYFKWN
jgi:hypothetical protein